MTVPDLGSERPGDPSDTRQLVERVRTEPVAANVSSRAFLIAFGIIAALIAAMIVLLR